MSLILQAIARAARQPGGLERLARATEDVALCSMAQSIDRLERDSLITAEQATELRKRLPSRLGS